MKPPTLDELVREKLLRRQVEFDKRCQTPCSSPEVQWAHVDRMMERLADWLYHVAVKLDEGENVLGVIPREDY